MIYSKSAAVSAAAILCITAITSAYWASAFSINQKYGLVVIGVLEVALFAWIVMSCRRAS